MTDTAAAAQTLARGLLDAAAATRASRTRPIPAADLWTVALSAKACLLLDAARTYGLVTGGPQVNVQRCEDVIEQAELAGHTFTEEDIDAAVTDLVAQLLNGGRRG